MSRPGARGRHAERGAILAEQLERNTLDIARIAAVYRGRPSVERTPMKTADWP